MTKNLHHNTKVVNKVIVQLMKSFKSLFLHCDITDVSLYSHDTQHYPKHVGESSSQTVNKV